jgi:predicted transcriptional regulator
MYKVANVILIELELKRINFRHLLGMKNQQMKEILTKYTKLVFVILMELELKRIKNQQIKEILTECSKFAFVMI